MNRRLIAAALIALPIAGCATFGGNGLSGQYGGEHVILNLGPNGGTMELDCANATLGAVAPRGDGSFTTRGTYSRGMGAVGGRRAVPATFSGLADPNTIRVRIDLADGTHVGPLKLDRGTRPTLYKCY
ncbi:hypothetical protein ABDK56_12500 [Sphingomonas sp. ASV193]|uniref:hypothetical protein n=1 Tax=Sphingomonas sp. ASV193 TaxID=3144405 RepID=UPI0032E8CD25